jgi:hypothetical protein
VDRSEGARAGEGVSIRGYTFQIDWSQQGHFTGTLEDLTVPSQSRVNTDTIEITVGRESQRTTSHATPARMNVGLRNDDKALSPENSSGPIYGKIFPGRRAQFLATTSTGATVPLIDGLLTGFSIDVNAVDNLFSGEVADAFARLGAENLSTQVYQGYRTGDALNTILDLVGWTGDRAIDPGATVMPYWWVEGDDPITAINNLVDCEGPPSIAYIQGSTFTFHDRHHRILNSAGTLTDIYGDAYTDTYGSGGSQSTFTHIIPAGSGPGGDYKIKAQSFTYDHGLGSIVNSVTFNVPVRLPADSDEVWATDDPIFMAAGDVTQIQASSSDPFVAAAVNMTVDSGTVSATLDRTSGQSCIITLTCTVTATITHLGVLAVGLPVSRTVKVTTEDTGSVARLQRQIWPDDAPRYCNVYDARAIADRIVATYATNRPALTFVISGYSTAAEDKILTLRISDRITVRNDAIGLNADFIVERLVYRIYRLDLIELEVGAQVVDPVQASTVFQFDVAGRGFDQGQFAAAGIDSAATVFQFDVAGHGFDQGVFAT